MDRKIPGGTRKSEQETMYSPLSAIVRRAPVCVGAQASIGEALETMERHGVGSIIVTRDDAASPLGIFTLHDLLRRVSLKHNDLSRPIAQVISRVLVTLRPGATAYQAAVTMARHGIRHILVVDQDGRLQGVVSQNDLFSLQRAGVKELSEEIRSAEDIATLKHCAEQIGHLAQTLLGQGAGAEALSQLVSSLNDVLTIRVIELTRANTPLPAARWCWIALGSEGRLEQTLRTDQDNGLIFEAANEGEAQRMRDAFLSFARSVNRHLDECGFPLCKGNIMAGNPQWCLSLDEWRQTFADWIRRAEPQALLNAAIFFDFRALFGEQDLADELRDWLSTRVKSNTLFLRQMAANALECRPPLGIVRDFVFDDSKAHPHTLDLKMYGSRPFVDAARILALATGVSHTGTAQRLREAAERLSLGQDDIAAIIDGFHFILLLRLRNQGREGGAPGGANRIDPDSLNELDRHILKQAFKQARKLQSRLQLDYRL